VTYCLLYFAPFSLPGTYSALVICYYLVLYIDYSVVPLTHIAIDVRVPPPTTLPYLISTIFFIILVVAPHTVPSVAHCLWFPTHGCCTGGDTALFLLYRLVVPVLLLY